MQAEVSGSAPRQKQHSRTLLSSHWLTLCVCTIIFAASSTQLQGQVNGDWPEVPNTNMQRWNQYETVLNVSNVGNLGMKWSYSGSPFSSPAVANGVVYVGSQDNNVYALDAGTGAKLWSYTTGSWASSPAVANGVVYVGSLDWNLYALDATTGSKLWSDFVIDPSSPVVANGVVYIGSNGEVYALNATTGAILWNFFPGSWFYSPAVANGILYVSSEDYNVYALDANTGAKLWNYTTGLPVKDTPTVANGIVYFGSDDNNVYALNASTGVKLWSYGTSGYVRSTAVANGVVYAGSYDSNVYALDASTGAKLWSYTTNGYVGSLAVANGVVYVGLSNTVYALDASSGTKLWSYATGGSPVVANGVVYVGSNDGNFYAFSLLAQKTATSTSLSSSRNPSIYGLAVTLTAKVRSAKGSGTPTGIVTFSDFGTTLGVAALSGGLATLTISAFSAGVNPITASYSGDLNHAPSVSSVLSQKVNQATSATVLVSSTNPSDINQPVTLTATVTSQYGGTPTGSVTFQQGTTVLGTAPLVNAQGTLTQTFPKQGTFNIKAAYSGDSNYKASTSLQLSQIVEAKQALYVGLPVLFVHGICGAAEDFQTTESTVQAFLQGNYPELYPELYPYSDQYWVFYDAVQNQVNFQVPSAKTTSNSVLSSSRFFSVAFDDPSQNLVQNFDRVNVSNISIYAKADELAHIIWKIKAITGAPRVIIVAHSMGGLVSRAYVERLGTGSSLDSYFQDISTLVTIDTPHGGSTLGELSLLGSGPCFTQETTDKTEMQPSGPNSIIPMLNYITPGATPLPATLRVYSIVSYWTIPTPLGVIDPLNKQTDNVLTGYGFYIGLQTKDEQDLYSNLNNPSQNSQSNLFIVKNPFGALFGWCGTTDVLHSLNCTGSAPQTLVQIEKEIQVPAVMNQNVKVSPSTATVAPDGSVQFVATTPSKAAAIWSLLEGQDAGSITANGLYTPGSLTGQVHVVAIDSVKSNDYGIATVTVNP